MSAGATPGSCSKVTPKPSLILTKPLNSIPIPPRPTTPAATPNLRVIDYAGALTDFDRAIELNPAYTDAYGARGAVKYNAKKYKEAIADFDQAIALNPGYTYAYWNRGSRQISTRRLRRGHRR